MLATVALRNDDVVRNAQVELIGEGCHGAVALSVLAAVLAQIGVLLDELVHRLPGILPGLRLVEILVTGHVAVVVGETVGNQMADRFVAVGRHVDQVVGRLTVAVGVAAVAVGEAERTVTLVSQTEVGRTVLAQRAV